jgi:hypothetical protein
MTESIWIVSDDPDWMLHQVNRSASERKLRLFACACCRLIWPLLSDERSRRGVEVSERYADSLASDEELEAAVTASKVARDAFQTPFLNQQTPYPGDTVFSAPEAALSAVEASVFSAVAETGEIGNTTMYLAQAKLIRDIFGNPFRPATCAPAWRTDTATALAQQMYDTRDFSPMPILADALQDAGCTNDDILHHCRDSKQVHVRGCWVVDLVLGKQ